MDLSPQRVRSAAFKTVRKGYDPDEVDAFLEEVADGARAAPRTRRRRWRRGPGPRSRGCRRCREGRRRRPAAPPAPIERPNGRPAGQTETISRTLVLAQRTADSTDRRGAGRSRPVARRPPATKPTRPSTPPARWRPAARRGPGRGPPAGEAERLAGRERGAVAARPAAISSVRCRPARAVPGRPARAARRRAATLNELIERVPGGLGDVRRPLLSASDDAASPDGLDDGRRRRAIERGRAVEPSIGRRPADDGPVGSDRARRGRRGRRVASTTGGRRRHGDPPSISTISGHRADRRCESGDPDGVGR